MWRMKRRKNKLRKEEWRYCVLDCMHSIERDLQNRIESNKSMTT